MNDEERACYIMPQIGNLWLEEEVETDEKAIDLLTSVFDAIRAEEREACAKLADNPSTKLIAAAIRARGNQ